MSATDTNSPDGNLGALLKAAFQVEASDIHIKGGAVPMYRINGQLRPVDFAEVDSADLEKFCQLISGRTQDQVASAYQFEFSYDWPGLGRFRGNFYRQMGRPALALRPIPLEIASMKELRLPAATKRICQLTHGFVLVTGATGMGKSTTLASIMAGIAQSSCRHIVTIEDPVEYLIPDGVSCVTQREVGRDVESFELGLRAALRQDPDVLMIGEVRDRETMEIALHAAQSGHLILSTAHFADSIATVNGIVGMAPRAEQLNWRSRLAESLQAVISQRLLPRADGTGRVLATELLLNEPSVRACVVDESKTKSIRTCLERGRAALGTHTLDQCLIELLENKLITVETARWCAASPGDLMREVHLRRMV